MALPSVDDHLAWLRAEGLRLGEVAAATPLSLPVPGCPEWDVEALLRHVGGVHRWAAGIVRERLMARPNRDDHGPGDREGLIAWYRDGHLELLDALARAAPDELCWTWLPGSRPLAFWARRQAHETAIHRLDVEQAGGTATPFPAVAAADGVDELLTLAALRGRVPDGGGRRLHLAATDTPGEWVIELHPDCLIVRSGDSDGDLSVRAPATDLFALVMNRREATGLDLEGDADVLRAWRDSVHF